MGRIRIAEKRTGNAAWRALLLRASGFALAGASVVALAAPSVAQDSPAATPAKPQTGIPAWGIASADLPSDPAVRYGVLPNGMRYALKRNETPKGAASVRFAIDVGMREATPAQAGAPHFLEHMAFNGSTNIPEGELIKRLERLGLAFGADTNAETDIEHTTYKLDLPNTKPETVEAALLFMREIASELTLAPAAVERERGILIAESTARNVPQLRRLLDTVGKQVPDERFGPSLVGTPATLSKLSADQLRAFYEAYYRPERATMVIVGDFDIDAMERVVRARFADWKGKGTAGTSYIPAIPVPAQPVIATFTDPAIQEIIQIDRTTAYKAPANTAAEQVNDLLEAVATSALTNRLSTLARTADSPIVGAQASVQNVGRTARLASQLVVAKEGQTMAALALAEQQLRQARQFGFTNAEVAEAKANIRTNLENAVKQEAGRTSASIASALATASLANSVTLTPSTTLALYNAIEPSITAQSVSAAFKAAYGDGPSLVHVSTKAPVPGGEATLAAAFAESARVAVSAPVEEATKAFAYDDFGTPGKVVADSVIADLGIRTIRFANGVVLNLKKTDFEPGKVVWQAGIGSGVQTMSADKPGLSLMIPFVTSNDGLKAHKMDELRRITAGRQVGLGLNAGERALFGSGVTTQADLALQMKLVAAQIVAPTYAPETQAQWAGLAPVAAKSIGGNPSQVAAIALPYIIAGNDPRFGLQDLGVLTKLTVDDVKAFMAPQLANGAIEIGVVGDIDEAATIAAVAASLGALPARAAAGTAPANAVPVKMTADRSVRTIYHAGAPDQGVITMAWPTTDGTDTKDSLTRDLLAAVLQLRVTEELREKLGATYSPDAGSVDSPTFKGFGYISASATSAPGSMDQIAAAMRQVVTELRTAPPTADEMLRARQPILERWQRQSRENASWVSLVTEAQTQPGRLDRQRNRVAILEAIKPADLQASARTYLDPARGVEVRVVPTPPAAN